MTSQDTTAAEDRSNSKPGGWVLAAYVGGVHTSSSALNISQPALGTSLRFDNVRLQSRSFDSPLYYGVRAGYFIPEIPYLGVESEFIHLKVFSNPQQRVRATGLRRGAALDAEIPLGEIVQQYSISHGVNLLLFNVAFRYPLKRNSNGPARFTLVARAGVGTTFPHTESRVEGQQQEQYEIGRLAWQLAGGTEIRLWDRIHALAEYKFTRTNQRGRIFAGSAESLLRSQHGVVGLSFHF